MLVMVLFRWSGGGYGCGDGSRGLECVIGVWGGNRGSGRRGISVNGSDRV